MNTTISSKLVQSVLLAGAFVCASCNTAEVHDIVIRNANVVDVETGAIRAAQLIAIDGETIAYIGADDDNEHAGRAEVDAAGRYAIPGLWDMHVHIEGVDLVADNLILFPVYLAYGITTVRDMASDLGEQVLAWRDEIESGQLTGPRIYTAGRKIEGIDSVWKDDLEVATDGEMQDMMDLLDDYGVDFVKVTENTLQADLFIATVEEARKRGYLVSGHVPYDATVMEMARNGLSSIEHGSHMLRLGSADEADIAARVRRGEMSKSEASEHYYGSFDQAQANQGYDAFAAYGTWVTPTLIGARQMAYFDEDDHSDDEFQRYLTKRFMARYEPGLTRANSDTAERRALRKARFRRLAVQIPLLQEAGVKLLVGSDSAPIAAFVYPALALHEELQILQEAGLSPLQVLRAATMNGPRFFGTDDVAGSLAVGKLGDVALLRDNPLQDISASLSIDTVVTRGKVYDRAALDDILEVAAGKVIELDNARAE